MTLLRRKALGMAVAMAVAGYAAAASAAPPVYQKDGYAIDGYDAVAYFTTQKPAKGLPAYRSRWRDATWLFVSAANKATFDASPEKYAPQYGGHCSLAMAGGKKSGGAPDAWRIEKGKLYLNGSLKVRDNWLMNMDQHIKDADW